jgi:hypothetical protein
MTLWRDLEMIVMYVGTPTCRQKPQGYGCGLWNVWSHQSLYLSLYVTFPLIIRGLRIKVCTEARDPPFSFFHFSAPLTSRALHPRDTLQPILNFFGEILVSTRYPRHEIPWGRVATRMTTTDKMTISGPLFIILLIHWELVKWICRLFLDH